MRKRFPIMVLLLCMSLVARAQDKFFSTDKTAFLDELTAYLNTSTSKADRDEAVAMMPGFGKVWDEYYTSRDVAKVIGLCELMHAKNNQKTYFNIFTFVDILHKIPTSGMTHQDIYNWLSYSEQRAQASLNGYDKYLSGCRSVFVDRTLSTKGNSSWMVRDAKMGFPSDSEWAITMNGSLVVASKKDESVISNTTGVFHPESNTWEGSGGRVDWARFDVPSDKVYCTLPEHYALNLSLSEYVIDSVLFFDRQYFGEAILGRFEDKVLVNTPNERTMYPRVRSYRSDYHIKDILKDIDFEGGLGMMGNQIDVFGGVDKKAIFVFHGNQRELMRVQAQNFVMSMDENLVSDHASMCLYLNDTVNGKVVRDSLYHNNLGFRYENGKRSMMLYRSDQGYGEGPFHDHYHGMDIYLEAMYWNVDNNIVNFKRMEGVNPRSEGFLMSVNYFRSEDFVKLRGLDGRHPMVRLETYLKEYGNPDKPGFFYTGDFASYLGFPIEQIISLMLRLQSEGYLIYDADDKSVQVLPRFYDVLESSRENIDFDVLKFNTVTTGGQSNIRLDLNTNDLLVFGITSNIDGIEGSAISVSDRKRVVIVPDNSRIVIKKNRDFRFSGGIIAGMFEFFTKDCLFTYEDFMIDMAKVDSLRFYARVDNQIIPVAGTLEKLQGRLMIDQGNNKSSRFETPEYPIFYSDAHAYKFYRHINSGVFHPGAVDSLVSVDELQGKFYYYLDPFMVDSLNDLSMRKVRFDGELSSAGILPKINEPLVVMNDYSLGFDHQIGNGESDSYPMYDGQGRLHKDVHLSESGFYGNGTLDYLSASFMSDCFLMYPDSVTAVTNHFKMVADENGYPMASGDALRMKWDVFKPELTTQTIDKPICMYDDTYFTGVTSLSPESYSANGKLNFGLTEFDSDHFDFSTDTFVADSARFVLYSEDTTTVAFAATNYRADVDFNKKMVEYDYLNTHSTLDFPLNSFVCSLKEAEWDMEKNTLLIYSPEETFGDYATATTRDELLAVNSPGSKFISTIPEHDSLQFYSMKAEYDMTNYIIHAHDVKIIRVADAAVFPYTHDVDIDANSQLQPFQGELLADTLNRYHLFENATVTIKSRKDYDAEGYWNYQSVDGSLTPVYFDTIHPVGGISHASAHITDSLEFMLNPQIAFHGRVSLDAQQNLGTYDGHYALADSIADEKTWFASTAVVNPLAVKVPVDMEKIHADDPQMSNGLYYELAIDGGYFAKFLQHNDRRTETEEVSAVNGLLYYDADSLRFMIVDTTQLNTYMEMDRQGVVKGHGSFDLGFDTNLADFVCHGTYTAYPNDSIVLDVVNVFNAPIFDDKVSAQIADVYANMEAESIDLTQTDFIDYYASNNKPEKVEEFANLIELSGYPELKSSDFYNKTIVMPKLHLVWNKELKAFISVGKISVGNFGTHVVNKYVDGYVVFDHRLGNITYLLQNDMFMTFISYNCGDGQMQVHATYGDVNQRLADTKEKHRSMNKNGVHFDYVATPYDALLEFLNKLRYAGVQ